ncbi:MAG: Smr/MutS family protein, partial [Rikenellaceae bacterium]
KRELEVGDNVKMQGQAVAGKIMQLDKKKATVAFGHLTTIVTLDKLELISNDEFRKQQKNSSNMLGVLYGGMSAPVKPEKYDANEKRLNFRSDIDLRGARVEEALTKVQDLVDSAIMLGIRELRILHGKGTGALKEEIRKYLRANPLVISAVDAHVEFGGSGITMVTLDV